MGNANTVHPTKAIKGRPSTRVQLELPPDSMERLRRLKDFSESASYAEVLRQALRLYEYFSEEEEKGAEFFVKEPGKDLVRIKLFY